MPRPTIHHVTIHHPTLSYPALPHTTLPKPYPSHLTPVYLTPSYLTLTILPYPILPRPILLYPTRSILDEQTHKSAYFSFTDIDHCLSSSRNLSKPPISSSSVGIQRRSSMQGAAGSRKPPPPIRRTSSMVGSPQLSFPGSSPDDQATSTPSPIDTNNHRQPQLTTVVLTTDNMVLQPPPTSSAQKPSSASLGTLPTTEEARRGSGRKIPRMSRTASQPFSRTVSEEDRPPPPVIQKERSRLPRRSLSDTHAEIIQTLNEQFSAAPQTTAAVEKYYPARLAAGSSCGKLANAGRGGAVRSPEVPRDLGQIPEGVTLYRGVMVGPGMQKPSPVRLPKKIA